MWPEFTRISAQRPVGFTTGLAFVDAPEDASTLPAHVHTATHEAPPIPVRKVPDVSENV